MSYDLEHKLIYEICEEPVVVFGDKIIGKRAVRIYLGEDGTFVVTSATEESNLDPRDHSSICLTKPMLAAIARNPWLPMQAAPKDGTEVDLMFPHPRGRTVNCSWKHGGWGFYTPHWPNGIGGEIEPLWNTYPNMRPLAWMPVPPKPET